MKSVLCKLMLSMMILVALVAPSAYGQDPSEGAFVSRFGDTLDMTGWIWPVNLGFCSGQLVALEGTYKWSSFTVLTKSGQYLTKFSVQAHGKVRNTETDTVSQFSFINHFGVLTDTDDGTPTVYSQTVRSALSGGGSGGENGSITFTFRYTIDGNGVVRAEPEHERNVCPA